MNGLYDWVVSAMMLMVKSSNRIIHFRVVISRDQRYALGANATIIAPIARDSR